MSGNCSGSAVLKLDVPEAKPALLLAGWEAEALSFWVLTHLPIEGGGRTARCGRSRLPALGQSKLEPEFVDGIAETIT